MNTSFTIDHQSSIPLYKQLIQQFEEKIKTGQLACGEVVPSMNELAAELSISRETAKKTYYILRDKGLLEPRQGKGFYVKKIDSKKPSIVVLFDKLSIYKQTILNSFINVIGDDSEVTIRLHNQDLDLFEYYLEQILDQYDYYIVTPHFPLDEQSQKRMIKLISKIPNRKLIVLDNLPKGLSGNFGAVYQDFGNDAYNGLMQGLQKLRKSSKLNVITLPSSLYGNMIRNAVDKFCSEHRIDVRYYDAPPEKIGMHETFLILNSQLDSGIPDLVNKINENNLRVCKDVYIISYNEFPINAVVLGGLTVLSTDFEQMGELAAKMIVEKKMTKIKSRFTLIRRNTF